MSEAGFIWLRPNWLWGFLALLPLAWFWFRTATDSSVWDAVVDAELRPYVIENKQQGFRWQSLAVFCSLVLSLLLLAGPVWTQQEVPVFDARQAEVIVFDLSRSMRTDDVLPDRLTRAKFKLNDLLERSDGRQTALIAFSERPYVISPLTEDSSTVQAFVPSLEPAIMPVQGSRLDLAIEHAVTLLAQANVPHGHILVISDAFVKQRDTTAAANAMASGHTLSVLAVGTAAGAPLRDEAGQFVQTSNGSIVVPQLDFAQMQLLASKGGGLAVSLSTDDEDLDALESVRSGIAVTAESLEAASEQMYWVEYSPWFLWLMIPVLLLAFRRGVAL